MTYIIRSNEHCLCNKCKARRQFLVNLKQLNILFWTIWKFCINMACLYNDLVKKPRVSMSTAPWLVNRYCPESVFVATSHQFSLIPGNVQVYDDDEQCLGFTAQQFATWAGLPHLKKALWPVPRPGSGDELSEDQDWAWGKEIPDYDHA